MWKPNFRSRAGLIVGVLASLTALAQPVTAQDFPSRPLRVVVPYPPGSSPDVVSRLLASHLPQVLGQGAVVENRPGGGGVAAILDMMRAPADGYTVLAADMAHWGIYPAMQPNAPYDPLRDFAAIGVIFTGMPYFSVRSASPARELKDLVAMARAKPGELRYASFGVGSQAHLVVEALAAEVGMKVVHVPYQGGVPALESLLRGDVDFSVLALGHVTPHVKTGALRVLAVVGPARSKAMPGVPTVAEAAGVPGFNFGAAAGWITRSGAPKANIDKLSAAMARVAQIPEFIEKASSFGAEPTPSTPEQMAEIIRNDVKKMAQAVKVSGASTQ